VPQGWTSNIYAVSTLKKVLTKMTNLPNLQILLQKKNDSRYLLSSGSKYYFWNSVLESGDLVEDPTDYNKLLQQMEKDITKVQVKPLPDSLD
jgi:hypothetical protein